MGVVLGILVTYADGLTVTVVRNSHARETVPGYRTMGRAYSGTGGVASRTGCGRLRILWACFDEGMS